MTLLLAEGFELEQHSTRFGIFYTVSSGAASFTTGRLLGTALAGISTGGTATSQAFASSTTFSFGVALKLSNNGQLDIFRLLDGGTQQGFLRIGASGSDVTFNWVQGSTVVCTTPAFSISGAPWYWVEVEVVLSSTSGSVSIYVNKPVGGAADASASGVQTCANASNAADRVMYQPGASGRIMDDIYVCNSAGAAPWNARMGNLIIGHTKPTSDGTTIAFTPNTGTNFGAVDDAVNAAPNNDTDYIKATADGIKDTYGMSAIPSPITGDLLAACFHMTARLESAGSQNVVPVVRTNGTDGDGTAMAVNTTSYKQYRSYLQVDPNSGVAFDFAEVAAGEMGLKTTA